MALVAVCVGAAHFEGGDARRSQTTLVMVLLEGILPEYRFHEVHAVAVNAPPAEVFAALGAITPADLPVFRMLMAVRSLPAWAAGRRPAFGRGAEPLLQQAKRAGFVALDEEPDRELVLGTVGQPWRLRAGVSAPVRTPEDFTAFHEPGFAKIATNFRLDEAVSPQGRARLSTETRWLADSATARRFAAYWVLIRPGSGLIRREWLWRIKTRAETPAGS